MFTGCAVSVYRLVISSALCLLVAACAQNAPLTASSQETPSLTAVRPATLTIYRSLGGPVSPPLSANGQSLGRLGEAGYLSHALAAGPVALEVANSSDPRAGVVGAKQSLNLASGQTVYWRLDMKAGANGQPFTAYWTEVPAAEARLEIRKLAR